VKKFLSEFTFVALTIIFFEYLVYQFIDVEITTMKILLGICYAFAICCIANLFNDRINYSIFYPIVIIFLTVLYLAQVVFFSVFKRFLLLADAIRFRELLRVTDGASNFFQITYILFAVPILIFIVLLAIKVVKKIEWERGSYKKAVILILVAALGCGAANSKKYTTTSIVESYKIENTTKYLEKYGVLDLFVQNTINTVFFEKEVSELADFYNEFYIPKVNNELTGQYAGKNFIFILGESMGTYAIDEELTPTLYKLATEGYNFTNYYATRLNTLKSEYSLLTSFYLTTEKESEEFSSVATMPTLFKEQGYSAQAFHNYYESFYNRDYKHLELGFDNFFGAEALDIEPTNLYIVTKDSELFENSIPHFPDEQPYFSYYLTMSAHGPYELGHRKFADNNLPIVQAKYPNMPKEAQLYLASSMETDYGVEILLDKLSERGELENTVIAFAGDHYPYMMTEDSLTEGYGFEDDLISYKVPFIIWDASMPAKEITTPASNVSVLPIIANMFDLNLEYGMGVDIFGDMVPFVEWHDDRGYSFVIGNKSYDGLTDTLTNLTDDELNEYLVKSYKRVKLNDLELEYKENLA
jgi:Phosphoglycerol transferase and related proteins, alkaline phosphatase superfamily